MKRILQEGVCKIITRQARSFEDMTRSASFLLAIAAVLCCLVPVTAQDEIGPEQPLIYTGSSETMIGTGPTESGTREYIGKVRFQQGNVIVTCDRAFHYLLLNRVELYGNVKVVQGTMTMLAPLATYDGGNFMTDARGGVTVIDGNRTIKSTKASYSTKAHVATFVDSVRVVDDSTRIWADTVIHERDTRINRAMGRVVISDSVGTAWLSGERAYHDQNRGYMQITGDASAWQWDPDEQDTMHIRADSLETWRGDSAFYLANGNAEMVRGSVSARSQRMKYAMDSGIIMLEQDPILWSDSMLLKSDTIRVDAPQRVLHKVTGTGNAIMVNHTDTVHPDRFDQISGREIVIGIVKDTVRKLTAVDNAKSIYFRTEDERGEGVARFTSDTIIVDFIEGRPEDIYWLGGVAGEHHPENLVMGRVEEFRLPGFLWRTDRPRMRALPIPFKAVEIKTGEGM